MSGSAPQAGGPLVICLTCGVDDQPGRIAEIEALANTLNGCAIVHSISGRTTALRVSVPAANADRLIAALTLAGGALVAGDTTEELDIVVLLTVEATP